MVYTLPPWMSPILGRRAHMGPLRVLCLALLLHLSLASSPVVQLDDSSFVSQVLGTPSVWLVEFVQNNCQMCLDFSPEYSSVAVAMRGILKVGVINCHESVTTCAQEKIQKIPAIKAYSWEAKRNPYTDKPYKDEGTFYPGPMRLKDVSKFATGFLPDKFVSNVSAGDSFDIFLASAPELPKVVLLSAKLSVPPMYKALSLRFRNTLSFGQASSSDSALVERFKATSFPAIFVIKPGKEADPVKYDGQVAPDDIAEFLRQFASESSGEASSGEGPESAELKGPKETDKAFGWIRKLSAETFKESVLTNEEIFIVAFTDESATEGCPAEVAEWRKRGQQLAGIVFAGEYNLTTAEQKSALEAVYKIPVRLPQACINFLLFPFGDDKEDSDPQVLPGDADVKAITQAVYDIAPAMFVTPLSESTFDPFAHADVKVPKFLLISSKNEVPPMWKLIATNYREGNQFGFIHESDEALVKQFRVQKFPSVVTLFPQPDPEDKTKWQLGVLPYQGPIKFKNLVQFVIQVSGGVRDALGYTLSIPKVEDDDQFSQVCIEHKRLCVVALLKTDALLDDFKRVAGKWEGGGQFSFLWVDVSSGSLSAGVATQLGVSPSALPTAVVVSPLKMRVASLPEILSFDALNEFLDGLLLGKVRTFDLKALPNFAAAAKMTPEDIAAGDAGISRPAPGADGTTPPSPEEEAPIEEEFELSDILSEHVEDEDSLTREHILQEVDKEMEEQERLKAESGKKKKKKKSKGKKKKSSAAKDEL